MYNFDVDVIMTFVDMADPVWKANYDKTKQKLQSKDQLPKFQNAYNEGRFGQSDIFELTLYSIKEFMPWARKIWLVVSNKEQVPQFAKDAGVEVILHEQIIPKKYLPTFNSCTIELFLHRIPGLADRFIYVNDDSPIMKMTSKGTFFDIDGLPINNYHFKQLKRSKINLGVLYPIYKNSFRLAMHAAGVKFYRDRKTALVPCHYPKPMLKQTCLSLWRKIATELRASITPFRSEKSVSNYLFCNYALLVGHTYDREIRNSLKFDAESLFGSEFVSINDSNKIDVAKAKDILQVSCKDDIKDLFKYTASISYNSRRRLLQNAAFMYAGLPQPMTFRAVTPDYLQNPERYGMSLAEMQKEYGFDIQSLWKDVNVRTVKKYCTLSHLLAVYFAKANNWPYVFVLEDDAWPSVSAVEQCTYVMRCIKSLRADGKEIKFIRLGYNGCIDDDKPEKEICLGKYQGMAGAHAYMVFSNFYDEYIRRTLKNYQVADYTITDGEYGAYVLTKSVFIQFNSILYTDKDTTQNISSNLKDNAVYIHNHIYSGECPTGYVDFEDIQKYINSVNINLMQSIYKNSKIDI